jgi:hypothetical protein
MSRKNTKFLLCVPSWRTFPLVSKISSVWWCCHGNGKWAVELIVGSVLACLTDVQTAVGYTGGKTVDPTYRQVCSGRTGHTEAVQLEYDPDQVSYKQLLDVFWKKHDPTQVNRQVCLSSPCLFSKPSSPRLSPKPSSTCLHHVSSINPKPSSPCLYHVSSINPKPSLPCLQPSVLLFNL